MEAIQLLESKGAFSIKNYEELKALLDHLLSDKVFLAQSGKNAGEYVLSRSGATKQIFGCIFSA